MKKILFSLFFMLISVSNINAQTATSLSINDTRNVNDLPNFSSYSIRADFKQRNVIGVPGDGYWSTNLTFSPWVNHDNTGDKNHQLNFNNGGIFYRNAFPTDPQWGGWKQLVITDENGNVGIGTSNPSAFLEIYSPNISIGRNDTQKWSSRNAEYYLKLQTIWDENGINQEFIQRFNGVDYKSLVFYGGNVGIGKSNPTNKLDVNGTIHSKEVKVDMLGWPDFVFKKEYNLPTLTEVEKHINEKGHLENIPSEEEVLKNGINLGEMNTKLLQKIEELTLYMIDQSKNIQSLMEENKKQNEEIMALKKSLSK